MLFFIYTLLHLALVPEQGLIFLLCTVPDASLCVTRFVHKLVLCYPNWSKRNLPYLFINSKFEIWTRNGLVFN